MFTPRLLSVLKFSCQFYLSQSRNFSSSGKYHVIKVFNTENKYLYGNLVETQKQRRKKVTKNVDNECNSEDLVAPKSTDIAEETAKDDKKIGIHLRESTEAKIKKSKSTKANSAAPSQSSYKKNEIDLNLSSDQFVFASTVPLSVENYPLINSDKSQFYSKNCELQNVYSYSFKDPSVKYSLTYPSVSKIIEDTMSEKNKKILDRWRQNMIKELGEEGFYKQNEATKARGHEFHTAVLHRVLGREIGECSEVTNNALDSLSWMLDEVSHPMAVESVIAHPQLGYKGVFDCVALFRNIPVVIDWKLSDKPKKDLKDTYDAPVQVTAYIGAINHDPNYKWGVDHGLVAVAYTNGDPCDVFLLAPKHCQIYWKHWLLRLDKFKARSHLHLDHDIDEKALQLT